MDRRSFLKLLGSVGAVAALPVSWLVSKPRTIRIAAFDASPAQKAAADVVCTGHNDSATFQAAIDRLAEGGAVLIEGPGTFFIEQTVRLPNDSVVVGCTFIGPRAAPIFSYEPGRITNTYEGYRGLWVTGNRFIPGSNA